MSEDFVEVHEFMCFRRFCSFRCTVRVPDPPVRSAALLVPNNPQIPLVVRASDDGKALLTVETFFQDYSAAHRATLRIETEGGGCYDISDVNTRHLRDDDWRRLTAAFNEHLRNARPSASFLEIGSRVRKDTKSIARESIVLPTMTYVGFDIVAGNNVDMVGDIHQLSRFFSPGQFDVVYSDWVFEHVLMPWVAVVEINKVLSVGGDVFLNTNHSIGMHDMPWDFWRFSNTVWTGLFNEYTGFEIVATALGEPVRLTPIHYHEGFVEHHDGQGFQASAVWARKIGKARVRWDVDPAALLARLQRSYPLEIKDPAPDTPASIPPAPPRHYTRWWYSYYKPIARFVPSPLRRWARACVAEHF